MTKAETARDKGITRAVDHANRVHGDWHDKARTMLLLYIEVHGGTFMAEDVREWAERNGLPPPPDGRAWGGVFRSASAAKTIRSTGYAKQASVNCHCSPKNVWVAA